MPMLIFKNQDYIFNLTPSKKIGYLVYQSIHEDKQDLRYTDAQILNALLKIVKNIVYYSNYHKQNMAKQHQRYQYWNKMIILHSSNEINKISSCLQRLYSIQLKIKRRVNYGSKSRTNQIFITRVGTHSIVQSDKYIDNKKFVNFMNRQKRKRYKAMIIYEYTYAKNHYSRFFLSFWIKFDYGECTEGILCEPNIFTGMIRSNPIPHTKCLLMELSSRSYCKFFLTYKFTTLQCNKRQPQHKIITTFFYFIPEKYQKIFIVLNRWSSKHLLYSIEVRCPPVFLYCTSNRSIKALYANIGPKNCCLVQVVEEKINLFIDRLIIEGDSCDFVGEGEFCLQRWPKQTDQEIVFLVKSLLNDSRFEPFCLLGVVNVYASHDWLRELSILILKFFHHILFIAVQYLGVDNSFKRVVVIQHFLLPPYNLHPVLVSIIDYTVKISTSYPFQVFFQKLVRFVPVVTVNNQNMSKIGRMTSQIPIIPSKDKALLFFVIDLQNLLSTHLSNKYNSQSLQTHIKHTNYPNTAPIVTANVGRSIKNEKQIIEEKTRYQQRCICLTSIYFKKNVRQHALALQLSCISFKYLRTLITDQPFIFLTYLQLIIIYQYYLFGFQQQLLQSTIFNIFHQLKELHTFFQLIYQDMRKRYDYLLMRI